MESKAKDEDLLYAENEDYRNNIRRGNTIITVHNEGKSG